MASPKRAPIPSTSERSSGARNLDGSGLRPPERALTPGLRSRGSSDDDVRVLKVRGVAVDAWGEVSVRAVVLKPSSDPLWLFERERARVRAPLTVERGPSLRFPIEVDAERDRNPSGRSRSSVAANGECRERVLVGLTRGEPVPERIFDRPARKQRTLATGERDLEKAAGSARDGKDSPFPPPQTKEELA